MMAVGKPALYIGGGRRGLNVLNGLNFWNDLNVRILYMAGISLARPFFHFICRIYLC